jgi:hypothetical protein
MSSTMFSAQRTESSQVDTQNGAILGLKKAASAAFDPSFAATYNAIYYQKTGASTGAGNVETGTQVWGVRPWPSRPMVNSP